MENNTVQHYTTVTSFMSQCLKEAVNLSENHYQSFSHNKSFNIDRFNTSRRFALQHVKTAS